MGYLIDSNVISDYFSNSFSENAMDFLETVISVIPNISIITKIEILSWRSNITQDEVNAVAFVKSSLMLRNNSK